MNIEMITKALEESPTLRKFAAGLVLADLYGHSANMGEILEDVKLTMDSGQKIKAIKELRDKTAGKSELISKICRKFGEENSAISAETLGLATAKVIVESL